MTCEPEFGGSSNGGTVFKVSTSGAEKVLYSFNNVDVGILVTYSLRESFFSNCCINTNVNAVQVKPSSSNPKINNIIFTSCVFAQTLGGGAEAKAGVLVTTNAGLDINVTGVIFQGCIAYGWGGPGIEIDSGDIAITGGQYSSNGQTATNPDLATGIAVAGGALITISGVDCSGVNEFWLHNGTRPITQPSGIAISNHIESVSQVAITGCTLEGKLTKGVIIAQSSASTSKQVYIRNCDINGYSGFTTAVSVSGTVAHVEVTDCAGYNDLGLRPLQNGGAPPAVPFTAAGAWSYYGPVNIFVQNASTAVKINKFATGLTSGTFPLGPGDEAAMGTSATNFLAIAE